MRRAIVHIGLPRTGTTSFQRLLDSHRAALDDAGILYPDLTPAHAAERHLSHQHLGEALAGRRPRGERRELLALLEGRLGAHDVVILSYESLCLLPWWRRAPARLAASFARHGYAMEILATVKPQAELLNSTYTWRMQFLRERRAFDDFFHAELRSSKLDMARLIGRWLPAAAGRLTLVPVRDRLSDRPLIARLFEALGLAEIVLPFAEEDVAIHENPSPGPLAIAIDRQLHALGIRSRDATRFVETATRDAGFDAIRFNGLDATRCAEAETYWRAANDRLAALAWRSTWQDRVARAMPAPINELLPETFSPPARNAFEMIVAEALARFR